MRQSAAATVVARRIARQSCGELIAFLGGDGFDACWVGGCRRVRGYVSRRVGEGTLLGPGPRIAVGRLDRDSRAIRRRVIARHLNRDGFGCARLYPSYGA